MDTHTGLDDRSITGPALLEADQGDTISGKISRVEAAATVVAALRRPDASFKTFELRQSEAADAQGKEMSEANFTRMFLKLALGEFITRRPCFLIVHRCKTTDLLTTAQTFPSWATGWVMV